MVTALTLKAPPQATSPAQSTTLKHAAISEIGWQYKPVLRRMKELL